MTADKTGGTSGRRRLLLAGLAMLVVLGLALGAASLDEVRLSASGGEAGSEQDQPVSVGETSPGSGEAGDEPVARLSPYYLLAFYVIGALATVALGWRKEIITAWEGLAILAVLLVFLLLVIGMDANPISENATGANVTELSEDPQLGSGTGDEPNTSPPASALPTGMLVMVGVVLGVGIVLGFSRSRSVESEDEDEGDEGGDAETAAAIGEAAGRAADRMTEPDVDNPVYSAWRDMTAALAGADDPTLTPAEFRDRAIAAGLPSREVSRLTDVFREVRYGHEAVTPAREQTARESLRRVEEAAAEIAAAADADSQDVDEDEWGFPDGDEGERESPADRTEGDRTEGDGTPAAGGEGDS